MKRILLYFILILLPATAIAQQTPIYGLYFMDLYQINPAAAALKNFSTLHLDYRQQWRGIEGAPVTSTLTLELPVGKKVSIGFNFMNDKRGILTTNSGMGTFAYRIPFGKDHNLRFGLSMGLGWNNIDFSLIDDMNDPALTNALDNNMFMVGQFGALYNIKNFSLGFTFPTLFKSNLISDQEFQNVVLEPFKNYYITAGYRFDMGRNFAMEPWVVYRANETQPPQVEGTLILWIKNIIWAGATYRQDYGMAYETGFRISDVINLGYAYEPASQMVNGFGNGSHELHMSIRIGRKKDRRTAKETEVLLAAEEEKEQEVLQETQWQQKDQPPPPVVIIEETEKKEEAQAEERQAEQETEEMAEPVPEEQITGEQAGYKRGHHLLEMPAGHYVIIGAFRIFENAENYSDRVAMEGYPASFGFLTPKNLYYVWIYKGSTSRGARRRRDELRKLQQFKDAWYLKVVE